MNKTFLAIAVAISLITGCAPTQEQGADIIVGKKYNIHSETLDEEREILVSLPDSYDETTKEYSVLYILDGQRYFLYGVGFQKTFVNFSKTPEFIVVGIKNTFPQRYDYLDLQASKFLEFVDKDVVSFIDNKFRTSDDRMLFGWQYGGAFAIHALAERPTLFNAYFSASPFPLDYREDSNADTRIAAMKNLLSKEEGLNKYLYFTMGEGETNSQAGTDALALLLKDKAPESIIWKYDQFTDEIHTTTPYRTLYNGLENYYSDFEPIDFENLQAFVGFGGIKTVYEHYRQRGKRYGISTNIDDTTKFSLINAARAENNYIQFDVFINEFDDYIQKGSFSVNWGIRFGQFYLKHNNPDGAIGIFNALVNKFPNSAKPHNGLGDAYLNNGEETHAAISYKKAIELAENNSDPNLSVYEENLAGLKSDAIEVKRR